MTSLLMLLFYFLFELLIPQCIILFLSFTLEYLIFPDSTQSWVSLSLHPMTPDLITCPWLHYLTSSLNFTPEYVPNFHFSLETLFHSIHQINQIHS